MTIVERIKENSEEKLRLFNAKLVPTVKPERILGVRSPKLKALAKEIYGSGEANLFLSQTPHFYFEENNLHGFLLGCIKDVNKALALTEDFLPFVDNWATNDLTAMGLKCFSKNTAIVRPYAEKWTGDFRPFVVRFGVVCLLSYFLGDAFEQSDFDLLSDIKIKDDYYVDMAVAWYLSVALVKKYDLAVMALKENRFGTWVHNKAIRKAVESFRIDDEKKSFLRTLKR